MYKVIFIDLDGTLLNDYKEISEENINQLNRAYNEKDVLSIITTGRQLGFVKELCDNYNCIFGDIVIASNGAIVKNLRTNQYINKMFFDMDDIDKFLKIYEEEKLEYILVYTENDAFIREVDQNIVKKLSFKSMSDLYNNEYQGDANLCVMGGGISNLNQAIKRIEAYNKLSCSSISKYVQTLNDGTVLKRDYFDIVLKGCSKQAAINKVIKEFGFKHDEIMIIGDGGNDIPMFECGGLKVAMANAEDILKEKADYITDTNNNDGVAKAIKKFIFNEDI